MKLVHAWTKILLTTTVAATSCFAAVKPTTKDLVLPALWEHAGPQERLKALRVAELDATRLLVERIYGLRLNAETTVYDLVLADDDVRTAVTREIKGVTTTEEPEYRDDGQVWVVRAVKLRQVLETITRTIKEKQRFGKWVTEEDITKVELENRDTTIDVMGNGALPDSQGLRKIQAKRAAEVDAYRKLAERLLGVQITSSTTVKDFVLKSDKILARTAQIIKGAKTMAIIYGNDDSCEVKMQIKVADIYDVIERYSGKGKDTVSVERKQETTTFTETGRGAPRPVQEQAAQAGMPTSEADAMDGAYRETSIVIKKLVGQGIVVD